MVKDTELSPAYNIILRLVALIVYFGFLCWTMYYTLRFIVIRQRYKDFFIVLYYVYFLGLFASRIAETSYQFTQIYGTQTKKAIVAVNAFSVCIGLV